MPRTGEEELKAKKDKFIEVYLQTGNQSEAARQAGYSLKDAHKRGSELMQDPYVSEKIRTYQQQSKEVHTDSIGTIEEIFDSTGAAALKTLADRARIDTNAAKQFLELKVKFDKVKKEELGDFEGLSTAEIIREFDKCVQEGTEIKARIMEAFGSQEVPDRSDVPGIESTGV